MRPPKVVWACLAIWRMAMAQSARMHPQYLIMNKASFVADPFAWDQLKPESASQASIDAMFAAVGGKPDPTNEKRRLAFAHIITVFDENANVTQTMEFLNNMFDLAVNNDLPLAIQLDPVQWWNTRPDLWNWFNATNPGYNPDNVYNVEWTGWNATTDGTMLSWRDWGSQFRTPAPHPNLSSPTVLREYITALRPFLARVTQWYQGLPTDRKYLLAGVKLSEEVNIGINFYFYANGNSYMWSDPAKDPTGGVAAAVQQGYAAVCTAGMACEGTITRQQLDTIVQNYLQTIANVALQAGIPRSKLLSHVGPDLGDFTHGTFNGATAAVTPAAGPAWSIYRQAYNPAVGGPLGLDAALDAINGSQWSAGEWLYFGGNAGNTTEQWREALENTWGYRNGRRIFMFNYESVNKRPDALAAVQGALQPSSAPSCLLEPALMLSAVTAPGSAAVTLTWQGPIDSEAAYLDVSATPYTLPSGALAAPALIQRADVTGQSSFTFTPSADYLNSTLYAAVWAEGCGGTQGMAADALAWVYAQ